MRNTPGGDGHPPGVDLPLQWQPQAEGCGGNAVLEVHPGTEIAVRADGICVLSREDPEFVAPSVAMQHGGLWQDLREARKGAPNFEVRPFGRYLERIDEIVAIRARASIRRNPRAEYLILVNGQGFRMSNALERYGVHSQQGTRTSSGDEERPPIHLVLFDPHHSP